MTGERKKKLRILLRKKAAEELKRQQEAKANERRRVIAERTGTKKNFDTMSESELVSICKEFHERIKSLENEKWDLEYAVGRKEIEVSCFSSYQSRLRAIIRFFFSNLVRIYANICVYIQIHELSSQVNDTRGKFVKPPLKRVPKYEQKIERMLLNARKEVGFTVTLKSVKRDQFKVDEPKDNKDQAPDWSWKKNQPAKEGGEE